jgi:hypothetical protein
VTPAQPQHTSDQDAGGGSWGIAKRLIRRDPGASLSTLSAFLAFLRSVILRFTDSRQGALFTGLWVPSILALGGFYAELRRHPT